MLVRNRGRFLAPVALVAVIVAVLLTVRAGLNRQPTAAAPPHTTPVVLPTPAKKAFYVIKPGDSLSRISVKTGVSVSSLEALNPSVDPNALQTGQRIRLRR